MTMDEAVNAALAQIAGITQAIQVASQNGGKPIFMPDGRPVNVKAPSLGDLLLAVLNIQGLLLQIARSTAGALSGGFALSDQEAGRIADLILERLEAHEARRPVLVQEGQEEPPAKDTNSPADVLSQVR